MKFVKFVARCIALSCFALAPQQVQAQAVLFFDDFEAGLSNWTAEALWALQDAGGPCGTPVAPFPSGQQAARFGTTAPSGWCHFLGAAAGDLTLATPIAIPATALAVRLHYSTFESTECGGPNCGWDERFVRLSTDGGQNWTTVGVGGNEGEWFEPVIDLTPFRGNDVLIAFRFDPVDDVWNDFLGWYVDDVRIECDMAAPYCTAKVNSLGCTPELSSSGMPSFTTGDPFQVTATQILNQRPSKLIWSRGANATPFQGGVLCVQSPAARTTVLSSGGAAPGANDCSGSYSWVFTPAYLASKSFVAGETLHVQFHGRDSGFPAPNGYSLSAALAVTFLP